MEKVHKLLMTGERKLLILFHQVGMFQRLERAFQSKDILNLRNPLVLLGQIMNLL
jgi:hypothetical protein